MRAEVFAVYNKRRGDFPIGDDGTRAWNDYLEEREDVAFALSEGDDVEADEARERLEAYRSREAASIAHNAALAAQEARDAEVREGLETAGLVPGQGGAGEPTSGGEITSLCAREEEGAPLDAAARAPSAPGHGDASSGGAVDGGGATTTLDENLGLAERMRMRHRAGGYSVKLHRRRNLEEAMAAINMLLLET